MVEWIWTYALGIVLSEPRTRKRRRRSLVLRRVRPNHTQSSEDTP